MRSDMEIFCTGLLLNIVAGDHVRIIFTEHRLLPSAMNFENYFIE